MESCLAIDEVLLVWEGGGGERSRGAGGERSRGAGGENGDVGGEGSAVEGKGGRRKKDVICHHWNIFPALLMFHSVIFLLTCL